MALITAVGCLFMGVVYGFWSHERTVEVQPEAKPKVAVPSNSEKVFGHWKPSFEGPGSQFRNMEEAERYIQAEEERFKNMPPEWRKEHMDHLRKGLTEPPETIYVNGAPKAWVQTP